MDSTARPRVLVVAYDFPPHGAIGTLRTLRVVRQLHARGWDVTVLTSDPKSYLAGTPLEPALLNQVPSQVRVIRAGSLRAYARADQLVREQLARFQPPARPESTSSPAEIRVDTSTGSSQTDATPHRRSTLLATLARMKDTVDAALAIPDRHSGWLLPALTRSALDRLRHAPPDLIYSSAPPWTGQLVACGLKTMLNRPWVADFRDPWSRAPWREGRRPFVIRAVAGLERQVVNRADHIIFVAQGNRDDFAAHYGPRVAAKLHVVPNGCDPSAFDALERPRVDPQGPFVLLHAGSLYAGRSPIPVLRAIAEAIRKGVVSRDRFRLRFLGHSGLTSMDLPQACRELGIANLVEFVPRVPRQESMTAMMSASALLLLQPGHTVSVPGKVYEYLAAGRPILALAEEGETADIVRASGIGVSVSPDRESDLVDALASVITMAGAAMPPARRELYDGMARAGETVDILQAIIRGDEIPVRRDTVGLSVPSAHATPPGR